MIARFALILVNDNFLALANLLYCCRYSCTFYCRASDCKLSVVNSKNLIEGYCGTNFCINSFDLNAVALGYSILLPPVAIIAYILHLLLSLLASFGALIRS